MGNGHKKKLKGTRNLVRRSKSRALNRLGRKKSVRSCFRLKWLDAAIDLVRKVKTSKNNI